MTNSELRLQELSEFYDGKQLEAKPPTAAYLVTVGEDSLPHAAMISAGELLVLADATAHLALWSHSRTTQNLLRTGTALLLVVLAGRAVRADLALQPRDSPADGAALRLFDGTVISAMADEAPYAELTSGVLFELHDKEATLPRWRDTIRSLQSEGPPRA